MQNTNSQALTSATPNPTPVYREILGIKLTPKNIGISAAVLATTVLFIVGTSVYVYYFASSAKARKNDARQNVPADKVVVDTNPKISETKMEVPIHSSDENLITSKRSPSLLPDSDYEDKAPADTKKEVLIRNSNEDLIDNSIAQQQEIGIPSKSSIPLLPDSEDEDMHPQTASKEDFDASFVKIPLSPLSYTNSKDHPPLEENNLSYIPIIPLTTATLQQSQHKKKQLIEIASAVSTELTAKKTMTQNQAGDIVQTAPKPPESGLAADVVNKIQAVVRATECKARSKKTLTASTNSAEVLSKLIAAFAEQAKKCNYIVDSLGLDQDKVKRGFADRLDRYITSINRPLFNFESTAQLTPRNSVDSNANILLQKSIYAKINITLSDVVIVQTKGRHTTLDGNFTITATW